MRIGAHLPISEGLVRVGELAVELTLDAVQIFSRSPRGGKPRKWGPEEVGGLNRIVAEADLRPIAVHVPYLVNLASPKADVREYGADVLALDLKRAELIGAHCVVLHPGGHGGDGLDVGYQRLADALEAVLAGRVGGPRLLLENMSGQGNELGHDIGQLCGVIRGLDCSSQLGICLDACHAFAAGYDIRLEQTVSDIWSQCEQLLGPNPIGLVHANDSKYGLGSRRDRHANIGTGHIGFDGFRALTTACDYHGVAMILETPVKTASDYGPDISALRSILTRA